MEHTQQNHINLTKEQFVNVLNNALCNGLHYFSSYDLEIDWNDEHYNIAKTELKKDYTEQVICMEDVLTKMLEMKLPINIIDCGYEGEYNAILDLDEMYSNLQFVPQDAIHNILEEQDDAVDNDAFLQAVIYKDVIFC
jgi:hypothetical protein